MILFSYKCTSVDFSGVRLKIDTNFTALLRCPNRKITIVAAIEIAQFEIATRIAFESVQNEARNRN